MEERNPWGDKSLLRIFSGKDSVFVRSRKTPEWLEQEGHEGNCEQDKVKDVYFWYDIRFLDRSLHKYLIFKDEF